MEREIRFSLLLSDEEESYIKTLIENEQATILEDGEEIPNGITHKLLLDERGNIIGAERLRFS